MFVFVPRINAEDLGASAPTVLNAYFALHITAGHILLPILLSIFLFSKTAVRHPTLINVVISFIVSSIAACLLLYAGKSSGPEPSKTLCIIQTGLLNGVPPMWAVAVFTLVYHIWTRFARDPKASLPNPVRDGLILAAPYVSFVIWAISGAIVAAAHQDRLDRHRRFFYCSVQWDPFSNMMSIFSSLICFVTLCLLVHLAVILYRNWRVLRAAGQNGGVDITFVIRVFIFGLYIATAMVISLVTIVNSKTTIPDLFAATIGLAVALTFGTQTDVLRAMQFWKSRRQPPTARVSPGRGWTRQFDLADGEKAVPPGSQV